MKRGMLAFAVTACVVLACGTDGENGGLIGASGGSFACEQGACGDRKCDLSLGCVECLGDGDCSAGEPFCIAGRCEVCRTSADCGAASPVCWPGEHKCDRRCEDDRGCPGDAHCDLSTGACVECRTNDDCSGRGDPFCSDLTKRCVECISNVDCPAAEKYCLRGRCHECTSDADCSGDRPRCDLDELECQAGTAR